MSVSAPSTVVVPIPTGLTTLLSPDQLRAGLETLPQELYDQIYGLTFAYNGEARDIFITYEDGMSSSHEEAALRLSLERLHVKVLTTRKQREESQVLKPIKASWKPPVQLQVSQKTREDYIKKFYGSQLPWKISGTTALCNAAHWWRAQSSEARAILDKVVYVGDPKLRCRNFCGGTMFEREYGFYPDEQKSGVEEEPRRVEFSVFTMHSFDDGNATLAQRLFGQCLHRDLCPTSGEKTGFTANWGQ